MQLPTKLQPDMQTTKWKSILDPLLKNPLNSIILVKDIELKIGNNKIRHTLNRIPQGWFIVDINAASTIYRSEPLDEIFLNLNSSAVATISLGVF